MIEEDPYLAVLLRQPTHEECESSVPQRIAYLMHGEELGVVRNLTESDVPFMDLTWDEDAEAWLAEDWDQLFGLTVDERRDAGLPLMLLVTPDPCESVEDWVTKFG